MNKVVDPLLRDLRDRLNDLRERPRPVLSKADFVVRYLNHEFGNHSPSWGTLEEFSRHTSRLAYPRDLYHLRNRVAAGETHYKQSYLEALDLWKKKSNPRDWYCSMQVPEAIEKKIHLQGEVMQAHPGSGHCGLYLLYSTVPRPMREALACHSQEASGLRAKWLLAYHMSPRDYEWLNVLLDRYPGHVIEFSTYRTPWGTLWPLYHTCFWEVRNY